MTSVSINLTQYVRHFPDYPRKGILFHDINLILRDHLPEVIGRMVTSVEMLRPDVIVGIEARGFALAAAMAIIMNKKYINIRKEGKSAGPTDVERYDLEYREGSAIEIQHGILEPGQRVIIVDDVSATGGTGEAALRLGNRQGAMVVGAAFVLAMPFLGGMDRLKNLGLVCTTLIEYDEKGVGRDLFFNKETAAGVASSGPRVPSV